MPNNEGNQPGGVEQHPVPPVVDRGGPAPATLIHATPPPDQVTPHRITTIAFILDALYDRRGKGSWTSIPELDTPAEILDRSRRCFLILNLIQVPDDNLRSTCAKLTKAISSSRILEAWARRMLSLGEAGIAGLMDLFQAAEKLILDEKTLIKRSIVGILLRRMNLQFDKMSFSEVSTLQVRFSAYFAEGREAVAKLTNSTAVAEDSEGGEQNSSSMNDMSMSMDEYQLPSSMPQAFQENSLISEEKESKLLTRRQADLFIARQATLLQHAESEAFSPSRMQEELKVILKTNPGLPEAYFLSYLNSLRMNEFVGAQDSLYLASNHILTQGNSKQLVEDVNKNYRYAALNLASLHARLGHNEEALAAVKESIMLSQEAKDHACLQHALAWLTRASPTQSIALLQRSLAKCEELALPYLASLAMLSLCRNVESFGDRPSYILDLFTRSAVHNCKNNLVELQANLFLVQSTTWSTWGRPEMSRTVTQLLLKLNNSTEHRNIKGEQPGGVNFQGEAVAVGLVNIVLSLEVEGYSSEADSVLKLCERLYPSATSQYSRVWKVGKQRILFARALMSGRWEAAETCLSLLAPHTPDTKLYRAELLFRQGDFKPARDILQEIISSYQQTKLDSNNTSQEPQSHSKELLVKAHILLAEIFVIANDPGGAVRELLLAAAICVKLRLEWLHCIVCLHLANNQLTLGCTERALQLVRHSLTYLLAHGSKRDRSRGLLLCAKCRVAASAGRPAVERRVELLEGAAQVGTAKQGFTQIQDWDRVKDCLYLQARIYHSLSLTNQRNMAAQQYKKFDEMYPTISPVNHLLLI